MVPRSAVFLPPDLQACQNSALQSPHAMQVRAGKGDHMTKIRTLSLVIAAFAAGTIAAAAGAQSPAPASGAGPRCPGRVRAAAPGARPPAPASGPEPLPFLVHVRNARLLAANDLKAQLVDCSMPPENAAAAVTTIVDAPPTKVFDQLYYLGSNSVAPWAIVTRA